MLFSLQDEGVDAAKAAPPIRSETMATQSNKNTLSISNLLPIEELTDRAERLRDDVEKTARSLGRQARELLPVQGQRSVDAVIDRVSDVTDEVTDRVSDLRKAVNSRFGILRKETEKRRKKAVKTAETAGRKQVERAYKRLSLPVAGDLTAVKRRLTAIERKLDELIAQK
ncbi:MAG: hypothetical protein ACI8TX_000580 [Hyphomicrobiaceae bacterium]